MGPHRAARSSQSYRNIRRCYLPGLTPGVHGLSAGRIDSRCGYSAWTRHQAGLEPEDRREKSHDENACRNRSSRGGRRHRAVPRVGACGAALRRALAGPGAGRSLASAPAAPRKLQSPRRRQKPLPLRRSTAAGRAPTRRRAADARSSYQPQVASWADQKHMVAYAAVSYEAQGREEAGAREPQARGRHEGRVSRAARELLGTQDHRVELPDAARRRTVREVVAEIDDGDPRRRARHRARPRAGVASTRARSSRRTSRA